MNKKDFLLAILLLAVLAVAGCSGTAGLPENAAAAASPSPKAFETIYSGSVDSGDVAVDLTPIGIIGGKLRVGIGVNTHSVDLSQFDLARITTLEYSGKSLKPESAPSLAGHHTSGTLVFNVGEPVSSFKITIRGIPKVEERIFEWG